MALLALGSGSNRCPADKDITGSGGDGHAVLVCDLKQDHPGPLHYDRVDRVWWSADPDED